MTENGDLTIAHDLGTGGNKASVYDANGRCLMSEFCQYETEYPGPRQHEQRPLDWWNAIVASTRALVERDAQLTNRVVCIALSGHSLGVVPIDENGELLRDTTPIWSDTRPTTQTNDFFERQDRTDWYMTTGNGFPAECYSVFKIMWYRDLEPQLFNRIWKILGTKDYINYRLTGHAVTDFSYASGSGVYDLSGWRYSDDLILASGLPARIFPEIVRSTEVLGTLTPEAARLLGLKRTVRVVAGGVDNSCMALGARNTHDGRVYTSLGSSSWIAVSGGAPVLDSRQRPFVFAHVVPELYTSAVSIFAAGSAFRWLRDCLFSEAERESGELYPTMTALAETSPVGANKLLFYPSLAGGANQEPSPNARGAFVGLDLRHSRADLIRAVMEGVALNLGAVLNVLRKHTVIEETMLLVGGGSQSALWRQMLADAFGMSVLKTSVDQEAGALGAAALAFVGCGIWDDYDAVDLAHLDENRTEPNAVNTAKYAELVPLFDELRVSQSRLGDRLAELDI